MVNLELKNAHVIPLVFLKELIPEIFIRGGKIAFQQFNMYLSYNSIFNNYS